MSGEESGDQDLQRFATRPRTDPSGTFCPSRSHPFHSHTGHEVNEAGEPARVIVTRSVSCDPQEGHEFRENGGMSAYASA